MIFKLGTIHFDIEGFPQLEGFAFQSSDDPKPISYPDACRDIAALFIRAAERKDQRNDYVRLAALLPTLESKLCQLQEILTPTQETAKTFSSSIDTMLKDTKELSS